MAEILDWRRQSLPNCPPGYGVPDQKTDQSSAEKHSFGSRPHKSKQGGRNPSGRCDRQH